MYCPHCGTKIPEDILIWDELENEKWTKDFTCPECERVLVICDSSSYTQEGKTEINLY